MQINITRFFKEADAFDISRSQAEAGKNAGPESWVNAMAEAAESPMLTTPEQLDALRDHVKGFGAWDADEIAAWSDEECNALFIQRVAGDMREAGLDSDPDEEAWQAHESNENGRGTISRGTDGEMYYYLGN